MSITCGGYGPVVEPPPSPPSVGVVCVVGVLGVVGVTATVVVGWETAVVVGGEG
jgi:hypothetical protein